MKRTAGLSLTLNFSEKFGHTKEAYLKPFQTSIIDVLQGPIFQLIFTCNNNRNNRNRCEKCLRLTLKTPEMSSWCFILNFEHISHRFLVLSLLTLNK